jgi:hypothetical protein
MTPTKDYRGLIWTNHVIDRLLQRKIPQEWAWKTYTYPDTQVKGKEDKTYELSKQIEGHTVTLIVKPNQKNEKIILSCWVEPPLYGSIDDKKFQKKYHSSTNWVEKIYRFIKNALFPR